MCAWCLATAARSSATVATNSGSLDIIAVNTGNNTWLVSAYNPVG